MSKYNRDTIKTNTKAACGCASCFECDFDDCIIHGRIKGEFKHLTKIDSESGIQALPSSPMVINGKGGKCR